MPGAFLKKLINNSEALPDDEYREFMRKIFGKTISDVAVAAFIAALSAKKATVHDVVSFVQSVLSIAPKIRVGRSDQAINIAGTGGGIATFNVSTTAAFIASAAGTTIIKSGSYRYNSKCGSNEVLKALGLNLNLSLEKFNTMIEELNIGFVNPDLYSPVLKRMAITIQPLQLQEIGQFINMVGPFLCPVQVNAQLIGVPHRPLLDVMGQAAQKLNYKNTAVCWAEIGMDELSSIGNNHVLEINGRVRNHVFGPERFGFQNSDPQKLAGGDPHYNAELIRAILKGKIKDEKRDTAALNSAYLLYLSKKTDDLESGLEASMAVLENGMAYKKLEKAVLFSKK